VSSAPHPALSSSAARALAYHRRTKHHPHRYAASTGWLDWDNQPDPFRTYEGAPRLALGLAADGVATRYADLYAATDGQEAVAPRALDATSLAAFFELALGLTAWKSFGESRWALRADPSSGNLHPTEGYAVLPELPGVAAGLWHYVSRDHALELRSALAGDAAAELARALPAGGFLVGVTWIHWRVAWKYGERAFRYCQHDAGHVIATLRFAAAALGWTARLVDGLGDDGLARLLGLDREGDTAHVDAPDREHPECALLVGPPASLADDAHERERFVERIADLAAGGAWAGRPNALSAEHVAWGVIDDVAAATWKAPGPLGGTSVSGPPGDAFVPEALPPLAPTACAASAAAIVRQRRSAVALDGTTSIALAELVRMLDACLPRRGTAPWDVLPWRPRIHLALFVHRVRDLAPGVYLMERDAGVHAELVAMLGARALWERPAGVPEHLGLFRIGAADCRRAAAAVSCGQEIAADGAFSLGMLADFAPSLAEDAAWYRRLHQEAGVLGQVLYLEAEAAGVRGTGIGCFFDDEVHRLVGLEGERFQTLYHFTVGGPVDDPRLSTHPPYAHLAGRPGPGPALERGPGTVETPPGA
jgi:SagB-type dehydrogenase family enzyme